jgi:hypothetical protein
MSCKRLAMLLILVFSSFDMYANVKDPAQLIPNEIARLDTLIQATEQSLEGQKILREQMIEYQKLQEQYLKHPQDNDLLFKVIKSAYRTLQTIKTNHLTQTFDTDFIDELTVLSKPATKRGIPKT